MSKKDNSKCSCPYEPRKILTSKQAQKQPIGSFYHPTEKTVRSGACPIGYELRRGYEKKVKNGSNVGKSIYIDPTCVKNKGLPGKLLPEYKPISLDKKNVLRKYGYNTKADKNNRHESLLKASKDLTYKSVISRLVSLRTLTKKSDTKHSNIYDSNIKKLKDWRIKNPDLYKKKDKSRDDLIDKKTSNKPKSKPLKLSNLLKKTSNKPKSKPLKLSNLLKKTSNKPKSKPLTNLLKKTSNKSKTISHSKLSSLLQSLHKKNKQPQTLSNILHKKYLKKISNK